MQPNLAWLNTRHRARRSAVAIGSVAFAVLLLFMQAGFLGAARTNFARPLALFGADLVIADSGYLNIASPGSVLRERIARAGTVPGVALAAGVVIDGVSWRNPKTGSGASALVFAVPPDAPVFADPRLNAELPGLRAPMSALGDRDCRRACGPWEIGDPIELDRERVTLIGDYSLGLGLIADGSSIVSDDTGERILGPGGKERPSLGLVFLEPGSDPGVVARRLRTALPADVIVEPLSAMIHREQRYFLSVKPVGIIFEVGMGVAFIAGAVILYQALAADLLDRLPEYALMKALGHPMRAIYSAGMQQSVLFALLAFGPAAILAGAFGILARRLSGFPVELTVERTVALLGLTLAMAAIAALLALGPLRRADPARLFTR